MFLIIIYDAFKSAYIIFRHKCLSFICQIVGYTVLQVRVIHALINNFLFFLDDKQILENIKEKLSAESPKVLLKKTNITQKEKSCSGIYIKTNSN